MLNDASSLPFLESFTYHKNLTPSWGEDLVLRGDISSKAPLLPVGAITIVGHSSLLQEHEGYLSGNMECNGASIFINPTTFVSFTNFTLVNNALLHAKNDLYLFNVKNFNCSNSTIKIEKTAYLSKEIMKGIEKCDDVSIRNIVLIDQDQDTLKTVCNEENYRTERSLKNYCDTYHHTIDPSFTEITYDF